MVMVVGGFARRFAVMTVSLGASIAVAIPTTVLMSMMLITVLFPRFKFRFNEKDNHLVVFFMLKTAFNRLIA